MIKCKSEEARHFRCCVMNKSCEGALCMAWQWEQVWVDLPPEKIKPGENKPTKELVKTGEGYCAMIP